MYNVYTYHHAFITANLFTLFVHCFDSTVPFHHALAITRQIESCYRHLS